MHPTNDIGDGIDQHAHATAFPLRLGQRVEAGPGNRDLRREGMRAHKHLTPEPVECDVVRPVHGHEEMIGGAPKHPTAR